MKLPSQPPEVNIPYSVKSELLIKEYNGRYLHWDEVRFRDTGDFSDEELWKILKFIRKTTSHIVKISDIEFSFNITDEFLKILHEIDVKFNYDISSISNDKEKQIFSISSMMEESIASSQIEGAQTSRKTAKKLLRESSPPKDKSEQMIVNNYNATKFILENRYENLTPDLILRIHRILTENTLNSEEYEGTFRTDNSVAVTDSITGKVYHEPVDFNEIEDKITSFCDYVNSKEFTHPVIKAIIIHFIFAYIHPFTDGNGRVSRTLFYWYLFKNGYESMKFLSISKIINEHKGDYYRSFQLCETDDNDVTYFIKYNLKMISESVSCFMDYINRKASLNGEFNFDLIKDKLSKRQSDILKYMIDSGRAYSVYELSTKYQMSYAAVRRDLVKLKNEGFVTLSEKDGHKTLYEYSGKEV